MSTPLNKIEIERAELERFQSEILELLAQDLTPAQIVARLQSDPAFAPFQNYIQTFEPRFLEVASALVKKWGQRDSESREAGTAVGYTSARDFPKNS